MAHNRFKLTASSVKSRCMPPEDGEVSGTGRLIQTKFYWDTELRGFCVIAGCTARTFYVQKDIRGRSVRVKIGRVGAWTAEMARRRARELIVQMDQGVDILGEG